jgi:DNA polymerase III delta prime subunit
MIANLLYIIGNENIEIVSDATKTKQFLGKLIKEHYPDMRAVIGLLQTACVGGKLDVDDIVIDNRELMKETMARFLELINNSETPLIMRKAYNNEVLSFGNNGKLSKLCTPYGLGVELFNHIIDTFNPNVDDLMELVEYLYKIEHSVDQETQLFGFLLKIKSMNLKKGEN